MPTPEHPPRWKELFNRDKNRKPPKTGLLAHRIELDEGVRVEVVERHPMNPAPDRFRLGLFVYRSNVEFVHSDGLSEAKRFALFAAREVFANAGAMIDEILEPETENADA